MKDHLKFREIAAILQAEARANRVAVAQSFERRQRQRDLFPFPAADSFEAQLIAAAAGKYDQQGRELQQTA